ncbi:MAG: hypothetical protein QNJ30_10670 [Kiloniellales bacterium]|nr:hypothetical protein [Kiloniellales bacterium]
MTRLGVVVGLAAEAEIIAPAEPLGEGPASLLAISGADSDRAAESALRLIAEGAGALLSFGIAGALSPALRPGALILPPTVICPDGQQAETDPRWRDNLGACLEEQGLTALAEPLLGSAETVTTPDAKAALFARHGALAVDMESHAVATAALAAGLPFLVLRSIADPAGRALPSWAMAATGPDGRVRLGTAVVALCRRPWEIPAAIRLGAETRRALNALGRAVRLCPRLGLPL